MKLIKTKSEDCQAITNLILESRSVWNYPKDYEEYSKPLLKVDEKYLQESHSFSIFLGKDLIGFISIKKMELNLPLYIDHFWIKPEYQRKGYGRKVYSSLKEVLDINLDCLYVYPDPPAQKFYEKLGFVSTNIRVPSRVEGGPIFVLYRKQYAKPKRVCVRAILKNENGDFGMAIHNYRNPDNLGKWSTVGGGVEPEDKDFIASLRRELSEEFESINEDDFIISSSPVSTINGVGTEHHFFEVLYKGKKILSQDLDRAEILDFKFFPINEVLNLKKKNLLFFQIEKELFELTRKK